MKSIENIIYSLLDESKTNNFSGYDPYDGLNFSYRKKIPFLSTHKYPNIFLTQLVKLSPVNFRPLLKIKKHTNPKALALFLLGLNILDEEKNKDDINLCLDLINKLKIYPNGGWGYPFPWQSRTFFQEKNQLLVVPSCFVANALFKYSDKYNKELDFLADYFQNQLVCTISKEKNHAYSYGKNDKSTIFNVSALIGEFFCKYAQLKKNDEKFKYFNLSYLALNYVVEMQNKDGSWYYGPDTNQKWIDCIHTIYNLQGLITFNHQDELKRFEASIHKGHCYLIENFCGKKGEIYNFSQKKFPIEVHTISSFIIYMSQYHTITKKEELNILSKSVKYLIQNFYNAQKNFFYYRKNSLYTNKQNYMRWSNAYAFCALCSYKAKIITKNNSLNLLESNIMDINVLNCDLQETAEYITREIEKNNHITQYSLNLNKLVEIKNNTKMFNIFKNADIISADGFPILLLSKYFSDPLSSRVAGVDLFFELLDRANKKSWKICFFGSTQENIIKLQNIIEKKYPLIKESLFINGYFNEKEEINIVNKISNFSPQLLFLGFSSPQKEFFIDKYKNKLNSNLCMGVGGSFDIFTGKTKRAPIWMQKIGLEWFYRTLQEPKRMISRYLMGFFQFLIIFIKFHFNNNLKVNSIEKT